MFLWRNKQNHKIPYLSVLTEFEIHSFFLQMTLLQSLHKAYDPLMKVLVHSDIADLINLALQRMPPSAEIQGDLVQAKLELLRKTVETQLFSTQGEELSLISLNYSVLVLVDDLSFLVYEKSFLVYEQFI